MHDLLDAELWQLTANGLVRGIFYAALGAGLALVIGVTTRFHFAYALTYTVAPYAAFWVMDGLGVPFWPSALIGLAAAVAVVFVVLTAYLAFLAVKGRLPRLRPVRPAPLKRA